MGCVKEVLNSPITTAVTDIGLAATGNAEFIPVANAAERTAGGVAKGESFGKALGQGAVSGVEALGAQELAGAVGIGSGNDAFNSALGITGDNPAGTGLPDLGSVFSGGASTNAAGATVNPTTGATTAAPASTTSVAPSSGGFTGANAALGAQDSSINAQFSAGLSGGEDLTSLDLPGAATSSSPNLGSVASATPSSGGLSDFLPNKSDVGKAVISSALPLGGLAYEAIKGPPPIPSATQPLGANGAVTAPLLATEAAGTTAYNTGTLTPSQQADIDTQTQKAQNELIQQLSNEGVTNLQGDSRFISGMQKIQQDALAQKQAMLQQDITNAFSAAGAAGANLGNVANTQVANDTAYQNALASALAAIGGQSVKAA